MASETHPFSSAQKDLPIADVWSRTKPKYRRRALILLTINVCLFAGLACVAYWLRTGVVFAPRAEDYWEQLAATFQWTQETEHTPTGLSLGPINVEQVPMMIPVLGLILAALVSIPVLTAMLYRFGCALPFIATVGFIAVMPWLAIVLLVSCVLASVKPFRSRSRFASALMSLLPVVLYFFMASRQSEPAVDVLTNPADRIKVMAPLILATIASAIVMGIVLIIAKIVNYRPGAIAPLLAILFLTPAALFEFEVGRDELHYRLLEREFGPASEYFIRQKIRDIFEAAVEQEWARRKETGATFEGVGAIVETRWLLALDPVAGDVLTTYQDRAAGAADRFVRHFPDSIYACNALYLNARALDMQVDLRAFSQDREIVFYDDFPSTRSRRSWEKIEAHAPGSPTAMVALLRLAQLDAREDRIDRALGRLERLVTLTGGTESPRNPSPSDGIMRRKPPESSLGIPVARRVFEGRKLRHLLQSNRDPLYGDEPLVALISYDSKDKSYANNLKSILQRFPNAQLADNIELEMALVASDPVRRIEALERCSEEPSSADALPEAVYKLGLAYQEARDPASARAAFDRVVSEFGDSIWREQAETQLRKLGHTLREGT